MRPVAILPLIALASCAGHSVQTIANAKANCAPLAALDSTALLRDVFRMADDSMRGRDRGSPEGIKARNYLAARFAQVGLVPMGPAFIKEVTSATTTAQTATIKMANVVGMVRGSTFPDQYIVVTGHYDHVGVGRPVNGDSIYNGADDNASGSSALVTLGQYFVKTKPKHSIIFAAVDAEERGMVGSRGFVNDPPVPLDRMLVNVNMDMVGRNEKNELYASGPFKYPQLRPLVEASAACSPINLRLGHDNPANGRDDWTNQSDQGAFHAKGIPFVYFGVEDHPDYHKPSDTPERLMPGFYVGAIRTVADFITRFDNAPVARVKPAAP